MWFGSVKFVKIGHKSPSLTLKLQKIIGLVEECAMDRSVYHDEKFLLRLSSVKIGHKNPSSILKFKKNILFQPQKIVWFESKYFLR